MLVCKCNQTYFIGPSQTYSTKLIDEVTTKNLDSARLKAEYLLQRLVKLMTAALTGRCALTKT